MAPKKHAREPAPSPAATSPAGTTTSAAPSAKQPPPSAAKGCCAAGWGQVFCNLHEHYVKETPQRAMLIDVFLAFLVFVGVVQFLYCVLAGNFPFNAFLSGFCATVGQFVLTVSLRIQTAESNKSNFTTVSPERAFADYVVCSLFLHFFCVNFIN